MQSITYCNLILFLHKSQMAGIMNREFEELAQNRLNYLTWASDVELVLEGRKLKGALDAGTQTAPQQNHSGGKRPSTACISSAITCVLR